MKPDNKRLWYGAFAGLILLIAVIGYMGYVFYPRFDLPNLTGLSLLILAVSAGIASFFTPCSFPLLTALLARSVNTEEQAHPLPRTLRYSLALALGASLFLLLLGIGLAFGGSVLFAQVTFTSVVGRVLRLILGILFIVLGIIQLGYLSAPFGKLTSLATPIRKLQVKVRDENPTLGFFIFGFGYILAGFG